MSEREPITAELRRVMNHTTMAGVPLVEIGEYEFGHRCDAIDAVHAGLERENAELRARVAELDNRSESMHIGEAWRIGDELLDDGMVCEVVGIGPNRLYYYVDATDTVEHGPRKEGAVMGITDELRAYAGNFYLFRYKDVREKLDAIADRIDAEYQKAIRELNNLADASVLLPVDADGVPIHIGDSVEIIGGEYGAAVAIELCEDGGWNVSMRPTGWDTPTLFAAECVRHHHAPTVEDVLREMHAELDEVTALYVGEAIDSDERDRDEARIFAEYAKRLTLAGDAE